MRVSQIFLSDQPHPVLPAFLSHARASVRRAFPEADHTLYDLDTLRAFIAAHYPAKVLRAYDALAPYAYKADLGRYCLLYRLGGWYFDIAVRVQTGFAVPAGIDWIAFQETDTAAARSSWACCNGVLYARPGSAVMKTAIAQIVQNVKAGYYGITPLDITGPPLLGRALALQGTRAQSLIGSVFNLTPGRRIVNRAYVLPDGEILAWAKPREQAPGGDLTALGAFGVNNYNELWRARRVYQPVAPVRRRWFSLFRGRQAP